MAVDEALEDPSLVKRNLFVLLVVVVVVMKRNLLALLVVVMVMVLEKRKDGGTRSNKKVVIINIAELQFFGFKCCHRINCYRAMYSVTTYTQSPVFSLWNDGIN